MNVIISGIVDISKYNYILNTTAEPKPDGIDIIINNEGSKLPAEPKLNGIDIKGDAKKMTQQL